MIDFSRAVVRNAPFPMVQIRSCLREEDFNALLREFPGEAETSGFEVVSGGRRRLSSDAPGFYDFLSRRPAWKRLYESVNRLEFVVDLLHVFRDELDKYGTPLSESIVFDETRLKRQALRHRHMSLKKKVCRGVRRLMRSARLWAKEPEGGEEQEKADKLYVHFDISSGHDGYAREVHRDLDNRVAAFLVYFSDSVETGGEGGEFCVHELLENGSKEVFVRQPEPRSTIEVDRVKPEKNLFLMFLSTPNSYHSVPEITGAIAPRKFIYVAITASRALQWPDAYYKSRVPPAGGMNIERSTKAGSNTSSSDDGRRLVENP